MKKASKISLLAGAALFMTASAAAAASNNQDVVRDERGNVVVNTWNNCVLTKWDGNNDRCGAPSLTRDDLSVYFGFDSARLTAAYKSKLDGLIAGFRDAEIKSVSIVGFADEIGGSDYNDRLSMRRANAVKSYLSAGGINTSGVSLRGLGESSSKSDCMGTKGNEKIACLWRDRRVEIELVK